MTANQKPWWIWVFPLLTLAFLIAIPLFVWNATDAILNSTDGDFGDVVIDPSKPGYESYVLATPSHLTLGVDDAGGLVMVAIMGLAPNDEGGAILLLNPKTLLGEEETIASVFKSGGLVEAERALKDYLEIGFTTSNTMPSSSWGAYIASVSPVSVDLNNKVYELVAAENLSSDTSACCFYEGVVQVGPSDIDLFLARSEGDDSGQLRHLRQEAFWRAWIERLSEEAEVSLIPGEIDAGFGRMVSGFSKGEFVIVDLSQDMQPEATYIARATAKDTVIDMIPFPLPSNPGARSTVRLLDAVGGLDLAADYSLELVKAGAQILIIGNASEFGGATELIYHDSKDADLVAEFQKVLGGGEILYEPLTDAAVEITVIIGEELNGRD